MAEGFIIRRGGSAVEETSGGSAFSLISAESKEALPANAAKNTIAVITDQTIGKLYMQPTIPETAVSGDLVILPSKPSKTISLSEDGNIEFGIGGAYINIDGAWSFVDTYIRLDDTWALLWSSQLFCNNNDYAEYTGGWVNVGKKAASNSSADAGAPDITYENGSMVCDTTIDKTGGMYYTANQIDLTPYKTVVFEGEFTRGGTVARNFYAAVWSSIGTYYTSNVIKSKESPSQSFSKIEVDVSSVSESAYIGLGLTQSKAVISKAYLIPNDM